MKYLAHLILGVLPFALTPLLHSAVNFTYSIDDRLASGDPLNDDGWSSAGSNWIVGTLNSELYARNDVGVTNRTDRRIVRPNDTDFSFEIPEGTTEIELTIRTRSGAEFWEAGLSADGANVLGIGSDFAFNNRYFVLDGTTRRNETGTSSFGDTMNTISLRYDLVAGTASLVLNPETDNDVLRTEIPISISAADLQAADGLFIRTDSAFAGPSSISLTVVPEPSTAAFALLAVVLGVGFYRRPRTRKS